jgi:Uncharacterized protein conserved in bacteria (DUF2334)
MLVVILFLTMLLTGLVNVSATAQTNSGPLSDSSTMNAASVKAPVIATALTSTGIAKKYVVFRDDDIGFGAVDVLKALNQVHIDENVPLTLAIIPHPNVNGTGNELLWNTPVNNYLKSIVTNPLFEFAQHGYTHQNNNLMSDSSNSSEFAGEPLEVQYNAIRQGRDDMRDAFGVTPTTFVPPWDHGDLTTLVALRTLGFTEYCTGGTEFPKLKERVEGIQVERAAVDLDISGNYDALNKSVEDAKKTTDQFMNDPNNNTLIVAYHWWDFRAPDGSVDVRKVQLFRDYIDYVKNKGDVQFARLDRSATMGTETAAATSSSLTKMSNVMTPGLTKVSNVVTPYKLWLLSGVAVMYLLCFTWFVGRRTSARK